MPEIVMLKKEDIEEIFDKHVHQADVIIDIYRLVYPEWDNIAEIIDWPSCNKKTWLFICGKFMEFDNKYHKEVLNAGLWMNKGFSQDDDLNDWEVERALITLKEQANGYKEKES